MARNFKRDKWGRFAPKSGSVKPPKTSGVKKKVAIVPYGRASLRSQSFGVNTGTNISKTRRVSAGFYIRLERKAPSKLEKGITSAHRNSINAVVKKLSPHEKVEPFVEKAVRGVISSQVRKHIGGERQVGNKNAFARLGTSRGGSPSIIVRRGQTKVSAPKRGAGIHQYNSDMAALQGSRAKAKVPREQRRKNKTTQVMAESYALKGFDKRGYRVKR